MKKLNLFLLFFGLLIFKNSISQSVDNQTIEIKNALPLIDQICKDFAQKQHLPSMVYGLVINGQLIHSGQVGVINTQTQMMANNASVYRIASMTKPITTVAMLILLEEGKYLLDEPVSKYIPEFKNPTVLKDFNPKDTTWTSEPAGTEITIRQLLSHTSGIGYGFTNPKTMGAIFSKYKILDGASTEAATIAEKVKILAKLPLNHVPGKAWTYGLGLDVAGYLVEILSGKNYAEFCEERILKPLKMKDTHFFRPETDESRLVHVYTEINGKVIDAMSFPQAKGLYFPTRGAKTYLSGGSSLTSTAGDYINFMQMILNEGTFEGTRILSRKSIELMKNNQIGEVNFGANGAKFGLGFSIETDKSAFHKLGSVGRLGWGGFYNTLFWIDPKEKIIAVLMTQIYPTTHQNDLYEKFENLVYQAITD